MLKKILIISLSLFGLQLLSVGYKKVVFMFFERTVFNDAVAGIIFTLFMILVFVLILKEKKLDICFFSKKNTKIYIVLTVVLIAFAVTSIILTKNYTLTKIVIFINSAILTVIYEELIFRGVIWKTVSNTKNDLWAYITTTILFGLWHLGYVETIMWRTSIFNPNADILNIMMWKVITGTVLGVLFGLLRYKFKNTYASLLSHLLINIIGSC